ncbi:MAG TPA: DUF4232 domain-containing protein [Streptosporangiaceae bacterium]
MKIHNFVIAIAGAASLGATAIGVPGASAAASPPQAKTSDLRIWLGESDGAAGSVYYPLNFKNISGHTVTIRGYPGVSAITKSGRQLGNAAAWESDFPKKTVTLRKGATAHTVVRLVHGVFGNQKMVTAYGFRIYPPNQTRSKIIRCSFEALAKKGTTYLFVMGPIRPGVGTHGSL